MHTFKFKNDSDVALGCICELDGQEVMAKAFTLQIDAAEPPLLTIQLHVRLDIETQAKLQYVFDEHAYPGEGDEALERYFLARVDEIRAARTTT